MRSTREARDRRVAPRTPRRRPRDRRPEDEPPQGLPLRRLRPRAPRQRGERRRDGQRREQPEATRRGPSEAARARRRGSDRLTGSSAVGAPVPWRTRGRIADACGRPRDTPRLHGSIDPVLYAVLGEHTPIEVQGRAAQSSQVGRRAGGDDVVIRVVRRSLREATRGGALERYCDGEGPFCQLAHAGRIGNEDRSSKGHRFENGERLRLVLAHQHDQCRPCDLLGHPLALVGRHGADLDPACDAESLRLLTELLLERPRARNPQPRFRARREDGGKRGDDPLVALVALEPPDGGDEPVVRGGAALSASGGHIDSIRDHDEAIGWDAECRAVELDLEPGDGNEGGHDASAAPAPSTGPASRDAATETNARRRGRSTRMEWRHAGHRASPGERRTCGTTGRARCPTRRGWKQRRGRCRERSSSHGSSARRARAGGSLHRGSRARASCLPGRW